MKFIISIKSQQVNVKNCKIFISKFRKKAKIEIRNNINFLNKYLFEQEEEL